jgi:hypothetical protein
MSHHHNGNVQIFSKQIEINKDNGTLVNQQTEVQGNNNEVDPKIVIIGSFDSSHHQEGG